MKTRILLCVVALMLVAAVPGSEAVRLEYSGDGVLVDLYPTRSGAALVTITEGKPYDPRGAVFLRLVYVGERISINEEITPLPMLPERIVTRAAGNYVYVVMQTAMESAEEGHRVYYYRWQLPDTVVGSSYPPTVYLPVVR